MNEGNENSAHFAPACGFLPWPATNTDFSGTPDWSLATENEWRTT
jgi:hypothetical protein